jgi:ribosomal protein L37AE/L43A
MSIYDVKEQIVESLSDRSEYPHLIYRYVNFIISCVERNKLLVESVYTENHHILPKASWPKYKSFKNHPWNCAKLTARQHYISHIMLAKLLGGKMWLALDRMTAKSPLHTENRDYRIDSKIYEKIRTEKSKYLSESRKGKYTGEQNPMYGRRGTLSPHFGIPKTTEHKEKQKRARERTYTRLSCPVCGVEGESRMMKVWHFDNCGKLYRNKGSSNGGAKEIYIYDSQGNVRFECHGNFPEICRLHNLPAKPLSHSYRDDGTPIMTSHLSRKYAERNGISEYIGWFAKENKSQS